MTIVGMLPPICYNGDLLVDGGYINNIPVDIVRSMGVDTVIVVDVESKDSMWQNLTPYEGGISGWQILWDKWCPVPSLRFGAQMPKYSQLINQLTWMSHSVNLKRASEDYYIDLYMRPTNIGIYKLLDFHLMDRIVFEAYRYGWRVLSEWQAQNGVYIHGKGIYDGQKN